MQIMIDIDKNIYNRLLVYKDKQLAVNSANDLAELTIAVANGTPLPKGHGRLIDADAEIKKIQDISDRVKNRNASCLDVYDGEIAAMRLAQTIIEADTPKKRKGTPLEENDCGYNCENWIP